MSCPTSIVNNSFKTSDNVFVCIKGDKKKYVIHKATVISTPQIPKYGNLMTMKVGIMSDTGSTVQMNVESQLVFLTREEADSFIESIPTDDPFFVCHATCTISLKKFQREQRCLQLKWNNKNDISPDTFLQSQSHVDYNRFAVKTWTMINTTYASIVANNMVTRINSLTWINSLAMKCYLDTDGDMKLAARGRNDVTSCVICDVESIEIEAHIEQGPLIKSNTCMHYLCKMHLAKCIREGSNCVLCKNEQDAYAMLPNDFPSNDSYIRYRTGCLSVRVEPPKVQNQENPWTTAGEFRYCCKCRMCTRTVNMYDGKLCSGTIWFFPSKEAEFPCVFDTVSTTDPQDKLISSPLAHGLTNDEDSVMSNEFEMQSNVAALSRTDMQEEVAMRHNDRPREMLLEIDDPDLAAAIKASLESITPQHHNEEVDPDLAQAIAASLQSTAASARSSLHIAGRLRRSVHAGIKRHHVEEVVVLSSSSEDDEGSV